MKSLGYIAVIFVLIGSAGAASTPDGGLQSPFALGTGARELALGGTGSAAADATTAAYWNASRLANADYLSVAAFHCRLYDSDVTYQYFGLAVPTMDFGSFGVGIFRLGIGGIERRDESNFLLGEFDDNRLGVYLAYGRVLSGYDIGVAASMESHSIEDYSATSTPGLSLSVGRVIRSGSGNLSDVYLSVGARNIIAPSTELVSEKVSEPAVADIGFSAVLLPNRMWDQSMTVTMALTKAESVDAGIALGLEYNFQQMLYIRGGVNDNRMSFGAGLKYSLISFDYALVDRDLGSLHMFSVTTDFGKSVTERRQRRQQEREAEFARLMENQISQQNRQTMDQLVTQGKARINEGDLAEGVRILDRAMFFARSSGDDTTEIASLIVQVRDELDRVERDESYRHLIDSAGAAYRDGRYMVCRHLALQAATVKSDSEEASELIRRVDVAIEQAENFEDMVTSQLALADSLTSYGEFEAAMQVLRSLSQLAPNHNSVNLALRKAAFEIECAGATGAYDTRRFDAALRHLDSALSILPGHQWCLQMKGQINRERSRVRKAPVEPAKAPQRTVLSDSQTKQIDQYYHKGQELFAAGDLAGAVKEWEKILVLTDDYLSVRAYLVKAYKFIGVDLYGQNRLDEAISCWTKAIRLEPANEEIAGYISRAENEIRNLKELSYDVGE